MLRVMQRHTDITTTDPDPTPTHRPVRRGVAAALLIGDLTHARAETSVVEARMVQVLDELGLTHASDQHSRALRGRRRCDPRRDR
jgi:hypothetical protein